MSDQDNIILLTVDSLRADYCGFMDSTDGYTPTMDQLAEEGLVFENAIAPGPATLDSMPVIFSGDYYPRPDPETSVLDSQELIEDHMRARDTIPERLSRRGYETAAFTTNPWTSRQFGFDDGFDHFEDFMDVDRSPGQISQLLERVGIDDKGGPAVDALELVSNWRQEDNMFQSWETFYDDIISWTKQAEEPYFLWIFLVDAHMPFLPADDFRSQSLLATYAANLWLYLGNEFLESIFRPSLITAYEDTVMYSDTFLSQLTDDLADDDPTYVIHGDHGEEFGEQGVYGHGAHLSEEMIHTPLVVGNGPSGQIDQPFSLADLPLLLERLADDDDVDDLPQPVAYTRNQNPMGAARGNSWKYVIDGNEETLYRITETNEAVEIRNSELQRLGRDVVTRWQDDESERREIARAAREVADERHV
ncbi:sulfatase [Natrinema hispanicum]|uniref:Arylsulfatase n=1 Tax=Natrinema hispanicum TaxID=392421 RepID=A0A1I0J3F8_9EURY|nr:sulfatase [Natrinema hispanicum]SEU03602.1 arylsulfatase [Natrinema hispanicum]